MVLAIEADGVSYHESGSVRDRDRLRGEHLKRLGWSFHRIWSTNWFHDPQTEMAKLRDAYNDAVSHADAARPASTPPAPDEAAPPQEPVAPAEPAPAAEPAAAEPAPPAQPEVVTRPTMAVEPVPPPTAPTPPTPPT